MRWALLLVVIAVVAVAEMHLEDEDEGMQSACRSAAAAPLSSHLPSFCEYVLHQLGLPLDESPRSHGVRLACATYLFVRASEDEVLQRMAGALGVDRRAVRLFLSEFRQRRAEYFSRQWDRYEEMVAVNANEYREWKRGVAAAAAAPPDPGVARVLEFDDMAQLRQLRSLVVVVVSAPFCSWCRLLEPVFRQLAERALVARVDARCSALVEGLRVRRFPEVLIWRDGAEESRYPLQAARDVDSLNAWLAEKVAAEGALPQPPLQWQMALPAAQVEALRVELAGKRRQVSVQESLRAMGGCLGDCSGGGGVSARHDPPIIVFLGGGIAAGKSSLLLSLRETPFWRERGEGLVCVEADRFKLADPLFAELSMRGSHGQAALAVHRESTDSAERLLLTALEQGRTIVFDGTCKWAPFVLQTIAMVRRVHRTITRRGPGYRGPGDERYWEQDEELDAAKHRPAYRIWLVGAFSAVNVAVGRSVRRAILDGRSSPLPDLLRSHKSFAAHFFEYAALVDEVLLFDNTKSRPLEVSPPLVARKSELSSPLEQLDPAAVARFLQIANLDISATSVYSLHGGGGGDGAFFDSSGQSLETHAAPPNQDVVKLIAAWK